MTTITSESVMVPPPVYYKENGRPICVSNNCYAEAFGIVQEVGHLRPGEISGLVNKAEKCHRYTDEELIHCILSDCPYLGLRIRKSSREEVFQELNSWKVAVLNCMPDQREYDFHFLRQNHAGDWIQKFSGEHFPRRQDEREQIITDPATACYDFCYHLVCYYIVTKVA